MKKQEIATIQVTDLPRHLPDELFTALLEAASVRIERIVSHGHASPEGLWYDQPQHEWIMPDEPTIWLAIHYGEKESHLSEPEA